MPRGIPNIITNYDKNKDARKELAQTAPEPEVLGHIAADSKTLNALTAEPDREQDSVTWQREDGTVISITEPPPPWEVGDDSGYAPSDARRFVEVPPQWQLYWINPKNLNSDGWRDWTAVLASDHRVKVRVPTMISPEGYIRRGASDGDILCWMWKGWHESKKRQHYEQTRQNAADAVDKQRNLADAMRRGQYGPYIRPEEYRHPTHTNADGRSMKDA